MDLIEFIGFIISITAIVFLMGRSLWEQYQRRVHPEWVEQQRLKQEAQLKQFLRGLEIESDDEEEEEEEVEEDFEPPKKKAEPPPAPLFQKKRSTEYGFRPKLEKFKQESKIEQRQFRSALEDRAVQSYGSVNQDLLVKHEYKTFIRSTPSRAKKLLKAQGRKEMMQFHEILSKPIVWRNVP
jgi:hypothetical protein